VVRAAAAATGPGRPGGHGVAARHHHHDHVAELPRILEAHPAIQVLIHPAEANLVEGVTGKIAPGQPIRIGQTALELRS